MNVSFNYLLICILIFISNSSATSNDKNEKLTALKSEKSSSMLPLEYFTKKSTTRTAKISPDGKKIIVILEQKGKEVFGVFDVAQNKVLSLIGVRGAGGNIAEVNWVNNNRIVYSIYEVRRSDQQQSHSGELFAVNLDGTKHTIIFGYRAGNASPSSRIKKRKSSYASHEILDYLENDDKNILIAYYPWRLKGKYWRRDVNAKTRIKKLDVYTGKLSNVDTLPISMATSIVDNQGVVRFAIGSNEDNHSVISYKKEKKSDWESFSLDEFEGLRVYPFSFSEHDDKVYLTANVGMGTRALYQFNLETEKMEKLFHDESIDIERLVFDFTQRRIVYAATEKSLPEYHYLEPSNIKSKLHKKLMNVFKGQDVVITSATNDGSRMVVYVYSDTNPGDFYIFDTKTFKAHYLISRNSWIDPEKLLSTESVSFEMRDGETVFGYLTKPSSQVSSPLLPLVVFPHGGPHGVRDEWGYDWRVQLLASRGYAVLQVNFRGSGGYGLAFEEDGYGKWGTLMQDDITDATLAMIERKIADPNRICIYGASYGGYAALMGAVREPDLYKCAIGSVGVYDLPLMFEEGDIAKYLIGGIAYLKEVLGENIEDMKKRSPVYNVDKIKADILLIHGQKDQRVPIEQAERLMAAFDKINKPYDWLELKNEGHGYNNNKNRKVVYQRIIDFLDENIGEKSIHSISKH